MVDKVDVLGVKFDKVDMVKAREIVKDFLTSKGSKMIVTPNPEIVVMSLKNIELAKILNQADLCVPDGSGVVLASRILSNPLPERVAGFDLMMELFSLAEMEGFSVYLLGSKPGVAVEASKRVKQIFPKINLSGQHHGYLDKELAEKVFREINSLAPDLLLVGMGVPLQEKFLAENLSNLKVKVGMTVGGSFDVLAGKVKRAPFWIQKIHLEWLYRLFQEPRRFKRILSIPKFVYLVIQKKIRGV